MSVMTCHMSMMTCDIKTHDDSTITLELTSIFNLFIGRTCSGDNTGSLDSMICIISSDSKQSIILFLSLLTNTLQFNISAIATAKHMCIKYKVRGGGNFWFRASCKPTLEYYMG